jgi:hypothetical protein
MVTAFGDECRPWRFHRDRLADHRVGMRIAGEKRAVAAEQAHRFAVARADRPVEILEIPDFDDSLHDAEEAAPGTVDAARDGDHPGAGDLVQHRDTDEDAGRIVIAPIGEEVAVRRIDRRNRPRAGEVDDPAGIVDQRDGVGLRQAAQPADQEFVDGTRPHFLPELAPIGDAGGENHPARFLHDQIDGLNRPRGLLGQHDGEALGILRLLHDPRAVQVPDGEEGGHDRDRDEDRTTQEQAPAGAETVIGPGLGFHRQRNSLRIFPAQDHAIFEHGLSLPRYD